MAMELYGHNSLVGRNRQEEEEKNPLEFSTMIPILCSLYHFGAEHLL